MSFLEVLFVVMVALPWSGSTFLQGLYFNCRHKYMADWGGGRLHNIFGSWVQHTEKNWIQSDLRFHENERSKKFKINEKGGGSIRLKIKKKNDAKFLKSI